MSAILGEVRTVQEIGSALKKARKARGLSGETVAESLGMSDPSPYYSWERGDREGGCIAVTRAGAAVGLRPDQLYLREDPIISEEIPLGARGPLKSVCALLLRLEQLTAKAGSAIDVYRTHLQELVRLTEEAWVKNGLTLPPSAETGETIPAGTVVKVHPDGVKTLEPPAPPSAAKGKRLKSPSPRGSAQAGEEPATYGRKPRARPKKAKPPKPADEEPEPTAPDLKLVGEAPRKWSHRRGKP